MKLIETLVTLSLLLGRGAQAAPFFGPPGGPLGAVKDAMGAVLGGSNSNSASNPMSNLLTGGSSNGNPMSNLLNNLLTGGSTRQPAGPPSNQDIQAAQQGWRADTRVVSQFLSTAESMTPNQLQSAGSRALDAELDELTHKKVLDSKFVKGPSSSRVQSVVAADNTLENQKTFQFVVDALKDFSSRGASMDPQEVSRIIKDVNDDRCGQVLPAIDQYMMAAANVLGQNPAPQAFRPAQCGGN